MPAFAGDAVREAHRAARVRRPTTCAPGLSLCASWGAPHWPQPRESTHCIQLTPLLTALHQAAQRALASVTAEVADATDRTSFLRDSLRSAQLEVAQAQALVSWLCKQNGAKRHATDSP